MAHFSANHPDRLMQELNRREQELSRWLKCSPENAILLVENPVSALRAAGIGLSDDVLREFEATMNGIMQKLAAP
jgi:hypothetical protein